ncbi:unnamed protein product [Psylliodes chrysocephalus]|uniref:Uncharacterized protein n=1 Tax=Psylliodes chrysocephalus TaxID=3402493 RepID=A0A9P0G9Z0_9CUCU|nr:unnamed protein product [Psylliodes chrysocephala]
MESAPTIIFRKSPTELEISKITEITEIPENFTEETISTPLDNCTPSTSAPVSRKANSRQGGSKLNKNLSKRPQTSSTRSSLNVRVIVDNGNRRTPTKSIGEYSTMYMATTSPKMKNVPQSSQFLDWLLEFFWKCSSGCQDLPTQ